jgi:hypothetical protein
MVALVETETSPKPRATRNSRSGSQPRSLRTPYPRFSDARVGSRFYDKNVGHWTTQDPLGVDAGLNVYSYCEDNSINFVDPWGLYTRQQLIQAQRVAIDGGVLRIDQLKALANCDMATWDKLQALANKNVYGQVGEKTGLNAVIDDWEVSWQSWWMGKVQGLATVHPFSKKCARQGYTKWELKRQMAMLQFVWDKAAEQGEDISHYSMKEYLGL